jgi:hypothetical protein
LSAQMPVLPRHRTIFAVDIEGSTARTNAGRAAVRNAMYEVLEEALWASGITDQRRDALLDRGDGVMVLIHPMDDTPKTLLLHTVIPTLSDLLAAHNETWPETRMRMRAVVHAGEVHYDARGAYGEDLDIAFRLLDAPQVKDKLKRTTAPLVLVVSEDIYQLTVRHGYDGIDERTYEPAVRVTFGSFTRRGWVSVPTGLQERPWSFHPVTDDPQVDKALHRAGQEFDARAKVRSLDPAELVEQVMREARTPLPGTAS